MAGRARLTILCLSVALCLGAEPALAAFPTAGDGRIVFERDDRLFLANPDGSNPAEVTFGSVPGVEQEAPAFSPDGRFLAFTRDLGAGNEAVFVGEIATGQATQRTFPTNARLHVDPSFSPDGKQIVFAGDVQDGGAVDLRIFVMNRDGSGLVQLTTGDDAYDYAPTFSPDGEKLVFTRTLADADVLVMPAAGGAAVNLTSSVPDVYYGGFSPDGSKILFLSDANPAPSTSRLSTIPAEGGTPEDLTADGPFEWQPVFSPSGTRILFVFDHDPGMGYDNELQVMPSGGGAGTTLTSGPGFVGDPEWESVYRCAGRRATIVGDDGPEKIKGTKKADVIASNGGNDRIGGRGGNDRICAGQGKDRIGGGAGRDRLYGQQGKDRIAGNGGVDLVKGGQGKDSERQ